MTASRVSVHIAFSSAPDAPVQMWEDVTQYVRLADGIQITRGRADERASIEPGRLSLTLDNSDGRFTWGNPSSPYYPYVLPRKRIQVRMSEDEQYWTICRFDGYIDGWPAAYRNIRERAVVQLTATDRLQRLGGARVLRDALHEECGHAAYSSAVWALGDTVNSVLGSTTVLGGGGLQFLYGLQEQSSASTAGDVSGALGRPLLSAAQVGSGGTLEFGSAGIMPEGTAVQFSPASASNGRVLRSTSSPTAYVGSAFAFWAQFAWTGSTGVTIAQLGASPATRVTLAATPTTVTATLTPAVGTATTVTKTATTNDNRPHFAIVSVSGGTASLYVDELSAATGSLPADMGNAQGLTVGGTTSADVHQVAWVGYSNATVTAAKAGVMGMLGSGGSELSGARIVRLLGWLGIDSADLFFMMGGQSEIAYQATGGKQALDLIEEINRVESGHFFAGFDGRFRFLDRSYNSAWITVNLTAAQVEIDDFMVTVDTAGLVNDITVSRPSGATFRMRDEESVSLYGEFSQEATLYAATDDDLRSAAAVQLSRYAHLTPRMPAVSRDLRHESWWYARTVAMVSDIGSVLTITGLPAGTTPGGATSVSLIIEGYTEVISPTSHRLTWTTAPIWQRPWRLGDATYSVLGETTVVGY